VSALPSQSYHGTLQRSPIVRSFLPGWRDAILPKGSPGILAQLRKVPSTHVLLMAHSKAIFGSLSASFKHGILTDLSLPSLPHPFHFSAQIRPIPAIVGSPSSSPNRHSPPPRQINLPSTYHVLQNAMFAGSSTSTNYLSTQTTYRPSSPRMDEKGGTASPVLQGIASRDRDGSPRLFGVELKWIS